MSKKNRPKYKEKFEEEEAKNRSLEDKMRNLEEKNAFLTEKMISLLEEGKKTWIDRNLIPLVIFIDLLVAIIVCVFIVKQTSNMDMQTTYMENQTKILAHQDTLFSEQNILVDSQNNLMGRQNDLLVFQNENLVQQNILFKNQNEKIDIQTNLSEAERRGSLVFLMNNIFDRVDDELKEVGNTDRNLSPQLIGRISGLSFSLKPYKYLVNDSLLDHFISPERGQLLHNLASSELSDSTMEQINSLANFSFSELSGVRLIGKNMSSIDLRYSDLRSADISNSCMLMSNLMGANLRGISALNTNFAGSIMSGADLRNGSFSLSVLNHVSFYNADLRGADFMNCIVGSKDWIQKLERANVKGFKEIEKNYHVKPVLLNNGMTIHVLKYKQEESSMDWDSIFPSCNFVIIPN